MVFRICAPHIFGPLAQPMHVIVVIFSCVHVSNGERTQVLGQQRFLDGSGLAEPTLHTCIYSPISTMFHCAAHSGEMGGERLGRLAVLLRVLQ